MTGELYEIEDLLNVLNIEIDDSARISDGDITYFIFSSSNLESEQEGILEKLEIDKLENGLYCSKNTDYDPNKILEVINLLYSILEKDLWENVIKKAHQINNNYFEKTKSYLFDLNDFIVIIIKWNGKITKSESEFNDFINDFNKIIRFSCKKDGVFIIDKKYMKHPFWENLATIRNKNAHSPRERGVEFAIKQAERQRKAFKTFIDKESPDSNFPFDFIKLQISILEHCIEFLDTLLEDLQ